MEQLSLDVNDARYLVAVHIERRGSARASITKQGVVIRLPAMLGAEERRVELERLMAWASRRLARRKVRRYRDGEQIVAAGRGYVLRVLPASGARSSVKIRGQEIVLRFAAGLREEERVALAAAKVPRCLAREHRGWIETCVADLNRKCFRANVTRITLRNTAATWGSCSRSGSLSFSTRLLLAPREIVEYVCIHELAHRLVPNHSAAFWAQVGRALPEYEERRRWLRRHGEELSW